MSALFAATYPERTTALILYGSFARSAWAPDSPWASANDNYEAEIAQMVSTWGTDQTVMSFMPNQSHDAALREWWATTERMSAAARQIAEAADHPFTLFSGLTRWRRRSRDSRPAW